MKTHNKIFFGVLAVLLVLTSCEDFLYQQPRLSQTNELTLSTYDGLLKSTQGAYSPLYGTSWYGRDFVVIADLKGGNAKISPITSGRFITESLWNNTPTATAGLWGTAYTTIARVNNVINVIEGGFEEVGVTQDQLDVLTAECKFLRALAYFDLARMYCQPYSSGRDQLGVPVVLVTEIGTPARATLGEVYDQVVLDLEDAIAGLPVASQNGGTDPKGWATQAAAQALMARVKLYMEEWTDAAAYATDVIDAFGGESGLYSQAQYTTWDLGGAWGSDAGKEVIFEVYGAEGNSAHGNWDVISYIMNPGGYGDIGASDDVIDLYEDTDVRKNLFINDAEWPNDYWTLKYPGKGPDGNLREDDIPVLRLSEMFLIRAEAVLNGATGDADADLNAIRSARGASSVTDATLDDVYLERRMELCYEGHELFDLARTGRGLSRTDYDGAINKDIAFPDYRWAMPIPQAEIDANPNVEQNPGYSSN